MIVVSGGLGFLGSSLVRYLAPGGQAITVLDDGSRGSQRRLAGVPHLFQECDVTKPFNVPKGTKTFWHLAAVNGTVSFYKEPWRVLEVQLRGTLNALDACRQAGCRDFVLYSSSEAYQTPTKIPTPEDVPLVVPDPANPRYSYGGGKIAAELMVRHCPWLDNVTIIRPHNVYGPDMGYEHVIPEFIMRAARMPAADPADGGPPRFEIRSSGGDVRSFIYETDFTHGAVSAWRSHRHGRATFNVGTEDMVTMADLAARVVRYTHGSSHKVRWMQASPPAGGTRKRCPDTRKLRETLSEDGVPWSPTSLDSGLSATVRWYLEHREEWPI